MGMMINRRRVYGSKSLPYDAEVEYLQSGKTQYINTNYKPNNNTVADIVFEKGNNATSAFAGRWTGSPNYDTFGFYQDSPNTLLVYYGRYSSNKYTKVSLVSGVNTVKIGISSIVCNGTSYSITRETFTSTYPLYLFAFNNIGTPAFYSSTKIYSFVISENGTKKLDMIPVRVGGVGYMYDKVSGQLFGNAGTGSFILGPDV